MFVGREPELARLRALGSGARIVLLGPPGSGRTSLARQAFPDAPKVRVGDRVGDAPVVLVEAAPGLVDWAHDLEATLVVTRGAPVPGWERLTVPPLSLEEGEALLLQHRAATQAEGIRRILWATDGLPALVAAAARRLEVWEAGALADRLEQGLDVVGEDVLAPILEARGKLEPAVQDGLEALSWFTGPFEAQLAEAVIGIETLQALFTRGWLHALAPERLATERWFRVPRFARTPTQVLPEAFAQRISSLRAPGLPDRFDRLALYAVDLERAVEQQLPHTPESARELGLALSRVYRLEGPRAAQKRVLVQLHRALPRDPEVYLMALDARALTPDEPYLEALAADPVHGQAAARHLSRIALHRGAGETALTWAERAVAVDRDDVRSRCALAEALTELKRTGDAELAYREALGSAQRQGDSHAEAAVAGFLGMLYGARAEDAAARDQLGHAAELLEAQGDPFGAALYRVLLGDQALVAGEPEAARACFHAALAILEPRGAKRWIPWCQTGLVLADALDGRPDPLAMQQALIEGRLVEDLNLRALVLAAAAAIAAVSRRGDPDVLLQELGRTGSHLATELDAAVHAVQRGVPDPRASSWTVQTRAIARLAGPPAERLPDLRCSPDGSWFQVVDGARISLERRLHNRLVFAALLEAWRHGTPTDVDALLEAGWPGERVVPTAGAARVYTAIATLRRQGLAPFIVKLPDGYTLAPTTRIQFEATT